MSQMDLSQNSDVRKAAARLPFELIYMVVDRVIDRVEHCASSESP
jgi:hypothetical protein